MGWVTLGEVPPRGLQHRQHLQKGSPRLDELWVERDGTLITSVAGVSPFVTATVGLDGPHYDLDGSYSLRDPHPPLPVADAQVYAHHDW